MTFCPRASKEQNECRSKAEAIGISYATLRGKERCGSGRTGRQCGGHGSGVCPKVFTKKAKVCTQRT